MVLSTSQQVALAFTAVLFTFVVLPRLFGVGGTGAKETRFEPRYSRKAGPGPGAVRGQPVSMNAPGSPQSPENMQQMKKLMEQELKSDKYKTSSNKGYVFTLMPLYAIGVGVFAAYKFLKIKSTDDQVKKETFAKGAKKSAEAESQLNELEQRLAQTERMLNSILTQLDPLTNCVKSVAQEQKNEIMSQLHTIRYLMKKRGMDCPALNVQDASCERNLDDLIESLSASDTLAADASPGNNETIEGTTGGPEQVVQKEINDAATKAEKMRGQILEESECEVEEEEGDQEGDREDEEGQGGLDDCEQMPVLEGDFTDATNIEEVKEEPLASGLRRRNRPE